MAFVSDWLWSINKLLVTEGGFVDHPLDKGGPTNFGVTLRVLSIFRGAPATVEQLKRLTVVEAKNLYHILYWRTPGIFRLPSNLAFVTFNQAVHRGPIKAVKNLQTVLNKVVVPEKPILKIDGLIGEKTIGRAEILEKEDFFFEMYLLQLIHSYIDVCKNDPTQLEFLKGWVNRVEEIRMDLIGLPRTGISGPAAPVQK